jgi:hypothetical protein
MKTKAEWIDTARHVVDQILSALGNIEEPSEAVE